MKAICFRATPNSLTIDVTTGDRVTPEPIEYRYPLLFDEGTISLMT